MLYFGFDCGLDLVGSSGGMILFPVVWVFAVALDLHGCFVVAGCIWY